MDILVGYTGFVGSNLASLKSFDMLCNSKNICDAFGQNPELLVYAGVKGTKFWANQYPDEDVLHVQETIENIKKINPGFLVLISSVDVYQELRAVNELTETKQDKLHTYGKNRCYLEKWVIENIENYLIVRLPAIYGNNLKKNFIYDLISEVPPFLKKEAYLEVAKKNLACASFYKKISESYYQCKQLDNNEHRALKEVLKSCGIFAINYTDSRAKFQFYNLKYLWEHIQIAKKEGIKILNIVTEPLSAEEVYFYIKGRKFKNEISDVPIDYDIKTCYDYLFGGENGYIFSKMDVLRDIKEYVIKMGR